ncbi:LysR family transcriptional regulator [Inediibacterium massiliense]|uniref:LysR family transcriptional regulator n=1 Tax=Inediibacterium massiliense TaxID=1658111 RepID=UPI0006B55BF1|nr:LysR family transcriptional regulator [Inediibacterium massiliense]
MCTRQITFYTLAKLKSYTKTAQKLNITQPAVTQHIKYLEDLYGVTLIQRNGRQIFLTEEGKLLYEHIDQILTMERKFIRTLNNQSSIIKRYRLGATKTIGSYIIPDLLGKYKISFPNHEVILEVSNTEHILNRLDEGKFDLTLVEGNFKKEKYDSILFKEDELVPVFSSDHPLCKKREIKIEDLLKENLIIREKGSGTRAIIENDLKEKGYDYNIFMEIGDITAIKSLVKWNLGYTFLSREAIKEEVKEGSLKVIEMKEFMMKRAFYFIWRKNEKNSFIEDFIQFAKKI